MWKRFANLVAFVALALIGTALFLGYVIQANNISRPFLQLAEILAYMIVAFYALMYAIEKRRTTMNLVVHLVIWGIATTLVVVFMIL